MICATAIRARLVASTAAGVRRVAFSAAAAPAQGDDRLSGLRSLSAELAQNMGEGDEPPPHSAAGVEDGGVRLPAFPEQPEPAAEGEDVDGGPAVQKHARWTTDEVARLVRIVDANRTCSGKQIDWSVVEPHFPHRTRSACCQVLLRRRLGALNTEGQRPTPRRFSADERRALLDAVRRHGEYSWVRVAEDMHKATGIVRTRCVYKTYWSFSLCPKACAAPVWTAEMSARLREAAAVHGKDPVFLAYRFFPSYTPNMIARMLTRMDTPRADLDPRQGVFQRKAHN
ncbi:hypothetical protein IWQ56_001578 [Coemansia nantahalensis]|uniref:Uncharacterized protein n=1 Tax=Coemansia helicoidea TaxID=1286919 RepID=A0ACC1KTH6_9FUNG|nr:hypothetical protein IWQ56_001578 [Coemansia nantahalensis]KAJ2795105.1 hypothetical protein H4R21_005249 [Coemansia helicoidea]